MHDTGTWSFGGSADLFPGLTWENRPDMSGSEASEDLQQAWVAAANVGGFRAYLAPLSARSIQPSWCSRYASSSGLSVEGCLES